MPASMPASIPPSAAAFRRRAERCLRFADQLDLSADPSVPALRDMALEYEAAARALEMQPPRLADIPSPTAR